MISVSIMHVLCCCMWLEFTTYVFTVCELLMLWRHLIGLKEKIDAFLTLSSYGGESQVTA
jgi:hypothetical protein